MSTLRGDITELLIAVSQGDKSAVDKLWPIVYDEMRKIAHAYLRSERKDHTYSTNDLVHEAYLKLVNKNHIQWQNRIHFFRFAAQIMRRILVDYARQRNRAKRRGKKTNLPLEQVPLANQLALIAKDFAHEWLIVDDALKKLEDIDPRQSKIVELRYFAGLTIEDTAIALGISQATVKREWNVAKAWLSREMKG